MTPIRLVGLFVVCLLLKISAASAGDVVIEDDGEEITVTETTVTEAETTVAAPAPTTTATLAYSGPAADPAADAVSVLGTKERSSSGAGTIALIPMAGTSIFFGTWRPHVTNSYVAGLALELSLTSHLSLEAEGTYGDYRMAYQTPFSPVPFRHDFQIYTAGGNFKATLSRGFLQPYLGAGLLGTFYDGMTYGPPAPYRYSRWVGAGQLLGGVDVAVTESIAIGARSSWVNPLFNKLSPMDRPFYSPESGALSSAFWRFMGTVRVSL